MKLRLGSVLAVVAVGLLAFASTGLLQEQGCAGYPDVGTSDRYCEAIEHVQSLEVMTGQGDGRFLPDNTLTRAEAAAVLVRYLNEEPATSRNNISRFADADNSAWYAGYFDVLIARNIFQGYPDGTLKPGRTLTRAEWLKLFYVTQSRPGDSTERHLDDVPIRPDTDWYRDYLNDAVANDLIELNDNRFYPGDGQKRELVADLIHRLDNLDTDVPEIEREVVSVDDSVVASRFGATDAHLTAEASYDLAFGWNYPGDYLFEWSGQSTLSNSDYANFDEVVNAAQDLGKTTVGRIGVDATFAEDDYESSLRALIERYDGDGENDMPGLKVPVVVWQFDNDSLSASEYQAVMQSTYETVKAEGADLKVLQGLQYNMGSGQEGFWRDVYGESTARNFDYAAFGGAVDDLEAYKNFLAANLDFSAEIWLVGFGVNDSSGAELFSEVVSAFAGGVDKLIYGPLDAKVARADSSLVLANRGNRKLSFFAWETLINYIDRFVSVSKQSAKVIQFTSAIGEPIHAVWDGERPSGNNNWVGVDYLGSELSDIDFADEPEKPMLLW